MNCPHCHTENDPNAKFCINCGSKLEYYPKPVEENKQDNGSIVFVWTVFYVMLTAFTIILQKTHFMSSRISELVYSIILLLGHLSLFALPFAIKNKAFKIVSIILIGALVIYYLYYDVQWVMQNIDHLKYNDYYY